MCGSRFAFQYNPSLQPRALVVFGCISKRVTHGQIKQIIRILSKASPLLSIDRVRGARPALGARQRGSVRAECAASPPQGLESCLKGPDNYNSQVLIEATVIALTKLQPLLSKVPHRLLTTGGRHNTTLQLFLPLSLCHSFGLAPPTEF